MDASRQLLVRGARIEARWHGPPGEHAPTIVLLHEGLARRVFV